MKQKKTPPACPNELPTLEYDAYDRHRIVVWDKSGNSKVSPWIPTTETAVLEDKLFAGGSSSTFPKGICSFKSVSHKVLT